VGAEVVQRSGKRQRGEFRPAIVTLFNGAAFGKEIYPCTTFWRFTPNPSMPNSILSPGLR
jgi:hypothetical protein